MDRLPPYKIVSLGDSVLLVDFGNIIDEQINKLVHSLFHQINDASIPGVTEIIPGYSSLAVCYNVLLVKKYIPADLTAFDWISEKINQQLEKFSGHLEYEGTLVKIPVCYNKQYAPDLEFIVSHNKISAEEIIQLHTSAIYHIYMIGFLPGFSYMGMVDEKISIQRKPQPVQVEAGSVGIAGRQTGVYPLTSPGGWQIIGRTPLKLFDKEKEQPVLFKAGDKAQFYSITKDEFDNIKSRSS